MNQEVFDGIIKQNLIDTKKNTESDFVYREEKYKNYFSEAEFGKFLLKNGGKLPAYKGDELKEHGKKKVPPKMASVGSSSRFCFLALRDWVTEHDVKFEHACSIAGVKGGTPPQLDAFIPKQNVYIEAKCHEIFTSHTVEMAKQYEKLLINDFGIAPEKITAFTVKQRRRQKNGEYEEKTVEQIKVDLSAFEFNKSETMFDIKQLLCHLLGIKSQKTGEAKLVYMFFKPACKDKALKEQLDVVFCELKKEIRTVFDSPPIKKFCKKNGIALIAIAENTPTMEKLVKEPKENYIYLYPEKTKS